MKKLFSFVLTLACAAMAAQADLLDDVLTEKPAAETPAPAVAPGGGEKDVGETPSWKREEMEAVVREYFAAQQAETAEEEKTSFWADVFAPERERTPPRASVVVMGGVSFGDEGSSSSYRINAADYESVEGRFPLWNICDWCCLEGVADASHVKIHSRMQNESQATGDVFACDALGLLHLRPWRFLEVYAGAGAETGKAEWEYERHEVHYAGYYWHYDYWTEYIQEKSKDDDIHVIGCVGIKVPVWKAYLNVEGRFGGLSGRQEFSGIFGIPFGEHICTELTVRNCVYDVDGWEKSESSALVLGGGIRWNF